MIEISTAEVERFRTTDRHLELVRSGAVVRIDEMSTATRPAYAVAGVRVALESHGSVWVTACACAFTGSPVCDHALAAVEAELVRLFSLGAQAAYHATKREAVR